MSTTRIIVLRVVRILLILSMACNVIACSIQSGIGREEPTPTPVPAPEIPDKPTYVVQRGMVEKTLVFPGRVAPKEEVELFFRADGRVSRVYVKAKDRVEAGQMLAELDNADLYRQIAQVQLELDVAQSALQAAQEDMSYTLRRAEVVLEIQRLGLSKLESQDGRADVTIALANLQVAEAERKAAQRAYDERASQPGVEASSQALALERATINYTIVRANYDKVLAASEQRALDLEIERKRLELAELEFAHLATEVDPGLTQALDRAELTMDRLQGQFSATVITATISGEVTSVSVYEGRTVEAYRRVIVVSDDTDLEISADPLLSQKSLLTEGMEVSIVLPDYPGKDYAGQITKLPYPYGSGGGASVEDPDTRVLISIIDSGTDLIAGSLVRLTVTLEHSEDALWLPPAAIQRFGGRRFVLVDEGGRQRSVDVRLGIEGSDRIEILEGVEEGQVVVGQ